MSKAETPFTASRFVYDAFRIDAASNQLICTYRLDDWQFTETVALPGGGDWSTPAVREAARLVFLLAGVSYYKAGAPPVVDLGAHAVTDTEREFLRQYYVDGLGEFAFRSEAVANAATRNHRGSRASCAARRPACSMIPAG